MKTPLLSCLLLLLLASGPAAAQTLPVPSSVQPSMPSTVQPTAPPTSVPTQEDLDKLAAQAQKAVFDAAAKGGAGEAASSGSKA